MPQAEAPPNPTAHAAAPLRPRIGLALGSGAARGWAHLGVFRALRELGVEIDVFAGCSAGALVSGAQLMGFLDELAEWARRIGPIKAIGTFALEVARGGLVAPDKAFDQFNAHDREIQSLPKPWGAVATDLATGREVWLTEGSCLLACRASSAVPMVLQAAAYPTAYGERWLVDGAVSNPVPVNLARALGADRVIAVDLNAVSVALTRFDRPETRAVVPVEETPLDPNGNWMAPVEAFFREQGKDLARRFTLARARMNAEPQFFETIVATVDIVQSQLAQARARVDIADVRLTPDLSFAPATAFDQWEAMEQQGYAAAMAMKDEILAIAGETAPAPSSGHPDA